MRSPVTLLRMRTRKGAAQTKVIFAPSWPLGGLIVGGLVAGFALLFVFGFSKNKAFAYNAYLILAITQIPRQFHGISEEPTSTMIGLAIGLALLGYIWYVRSRLFPDFTFLWPRKISGKYVFSDSPPGER
jgi:hypothetical protein